MSGLLSLEQPLSVRFPQVNEWSVEPRAATVSEMSLGNEWSVKPRAATVSEISSGK